MAQSRPEELVKLQQAMLNEIDNISKALSGAAEEMDKTAIAYSRFNTIAQKLVTAVGLSDTEKANLIKAQKSIEAVIQPLLQQNQDLKLEEKETQKNKVKQAFEDVRDTLRPRKT